MPLTARDLRSWNIAAPETEVARHACDELRAHLGTAGGGQGDGAITLELRPDLGEHVRIEAGENGVLIAGRTERALVDGAMWLLEMLGCYWVEPGADGVAWDARAVLEPGTYTATPTIERRTLTLGQDALHDDWRDWMEWASRNRYNDIFFHDTPPSVWDRKGKVRPTTAEELAADRFGWLFERWDDDGAAIMAEARKRGLSVTFGGHHLPMLLPREHFAEQPDWFPERDGARDPRYNLCTSSPGAIAELQRNAERYFQRFAGPDLYHVIGDDLVGGGWCACSACAGLLTSDQALRATNAVAEVLARANPAATILHVAYHDTLDVPTATQPLPNVGICFAPRERDYSRPVDDATCARNRDQYWQPMLRLFDSYPPEKRYVFEYYSDAILFKGLAPSHRKVLPADIAAYERAGVVGVANLMVGDRPWVGLPVHAWWFAKCAWDSSREFVAESLRFGRAAFGTEGPGHWFPGIGTVLSLALDRDLLVDNPRGDVLDIGPNDHVPLQLAASGFGTAANMLISAVKSWSELLPGLDTATQAGRLQREMAQAEGMAAICRHLAARTTALDEAMHGKRAKARRALSDARAALAELEQWDADYNTPQYAVITHRLRRWMHRHCDEIERMLASPDPRPLSRPGGSGETAES